MVEGVPEKLEASVLSSSLSSLRSSSDRPPDSNNSQGNDVALAADESRSTKPQSSNSPISSKKTGVIKPLQSSVNKENEGEQIRFAESSKFAENEIESWTQQTESSEKSSKIVEPSTAESCIESESNICKIRDRTAEADKVAPASMAQTSGVSQMSAPVGSVPVDDDVESEEEEDEDAGAEEILEESPCGRYHKRKERVTQRDVPGIDAAFLAMDTDYAVQVVWNEVVFSQRKSSFKPQAASIKQVFDNLMLIDHPNIIKVHKYWTTENKDEKPRLIFITEYMPSRNMKQFLKTTRSQTQKQMGLKVWKRWCIQILSALSYLHSVEPPIIHGNLNCETLFIQHNGLIKIGSIAPDAIHTHVKTCKEQQKHFHFIAPEYAGSGDQPINEAVDIFAFGMCALEMAVHGLTANGENASISDELIDQTLNSLQPEQAEFIRSCIAHDPKNRPSARELLFRPIIFEVHQLKLLSAHAVVNHDLQLQDNVLYKNKQLPSETFAVLKRVPDTGNAVNYTYGKLPQNDLEKLLEDVSQGLFPLTNYAVKKRLEKLSRVASPEESDNAVAGDNSGESGDPEMRMIVSMTCDVQLANTGNQSQAGETESAAVDEGNSNQGGVKKRRHSLDVEDQCFDISLKLKLDDNTTRYLNGQFMSAEVAGLAQELVDLGFINEVDREKVNETMKKAFVKVATPVPLQQST